MSAHASLRVHETVRTLSNPMIGAADADDHPSSPKTRAAAETDVTETENALTEY